MTKGQPSDGQLRIPSWARTFAKEANWSLALALLVSGVVYQAASSFGLLELATSLVTLGSGCIGARIGRSLDRRAAGARVQTRHGRSSCLTAPLVRPERTRDSRGPAGD